MPVPRTTVTVGGLHGMAAAFDALGDALDVRIERDLVGFPTDVVRKAKEDIKSNCHAALTHAQQALEKGIQALTKQRLLDIGAEVDAFDEEPEDGDDSDE